MLSPFIERTDAGRVAFGVLGSVVLIITIGMVRLTPWLTWVSVGIALPAIVSLALQAIFGMPKLRIASSAQEAVFWFYAVGRLIAYTMDDQRVTTDELFSAGATFMLCR